MRKREQERQEQQERELKALREWIDDAAAHLSTVLDAVAPVVIEAATAQYRAAGMPYGNSDAGLERWLREMASAEPVL